MRILHVITSLSTGGAEILLSRLAPQIAAEGHDQIVISLQENGELADVIRGDGIPVHELGMRLGWKERMLAPGRLLRLIRRFRPDVVQTWMYHADLLGGLAARFSGVPCVVWGIHQSNLSILANKRTTLIFVRLCALASTVIPDAVVNCAHSALASHVWAGYSRRSMVMIPNGIDTEFFVKDKAAGAAFRAAHGIPEEAFLFGWAGRMHPVKDPWNFLEAAREIAAHLPEAWFVVAGEGLVSETPEIRQWCERQGEVPRLRLIGRQSRMVEFFSSLDVLVSSSRGEALPVAVSEAMSCGVPCVVTDVGDSAELVGDTGTVVPPADHRALAAAMEIRACAGRTAQARDGARARTRIEVYYSAASMLRGYLGLYRKVLDGRFSG